MHDWHTHFVYQHSDLIVCTVNGCFQLAILSYNAHAHTLLPWLSHVTDVSGMHAPGIQGLLKLSADQLSELSIMVATTVKRNLFAYKMRSQNGRFSSLLGSK